MEPIAWNEINNKLDKKYGESFADYIKSAEKTDSSDYSDRDEKATNKMFEDWWNRWQEEGLTELEDIWPKKRGAYVMLQLAYLEFKKKRLDIEIVTTKDRKTVKIIDGDTLDLINRESEETDIFLEYNHPTLTIKNANVIKKERKEKKK